MSRVRDYIDRLTGNGRAPNDLTRAQRLITGSLELGRYTASMLIRQSAPEMAAAMTYRTIFSLIPVFVLSLVFMRALLGDAGIREQLDRLMQWLAFDEIVVIQAGQQQATSVGAIDEVGVERTTDGVRNAVGDSVDLGVLGEAELPDYEVTLAEYLGEFVDNAVRRLSEINFGAITTVGAIVFIYAALSLLIQIEGAFNKICRAPEGRRFINRVTNYWTLLTLGTLLIFFSIALGSNFGSLTELPVWLGWASTPMRLVTRVGASWLVLLFAYVCMPNARVPLKAAGVGAAVAALLWEAAKTGLTWFVRNATDGQVAVYGSLAVIPLFLFWVYVTWLIVLFGLQVSVVLHTASQGALHRERAWQERPLVDGALGVLAIRSVADRFQRGLVTSLKELVEETGMAESMLDSMMRRAEEKGIVRRVEVDRDEEAFTLVRPAESISVESILRAFESMTASPTSKESVATLRALREAQYAATKSRMLSDLIRVESNIGREGVLS